VSFKAFPIGGCLPLQDSIFSRFLSLNNMPTILELATYFALRAWRLSSFINHPVCTVTHQNTDRCVKQPEANRRKHAKENSVKPESQHVLKDQNEEGALLKSHLIETR
jgi:hypothetical protein